MVVLSGHNDSVNAVAFSPDGRWLAGAGDDGCIWLWDLGLLTGQVRIAWGAKYVFSMAFSPDGQTLAAGTESSVLLLRESDGRWLPYQQWKDHRNWVTTVAFDRSGELLASGGVDGMVRVWDTVHRRRRPLRVLSARVGSVRSLAFSPDGLLMAAGGATGLGLWRANEGEPLLFHRLKDADARSVSFSPGGDALLAAVGRSVLRVDGATSHVEELVRGAPGSFRSVAHSPAEALALIGRDDGTVVAWDLATAAEHRQFSFHAGSVNTVAFHPDGLMAASGSDDCGVCLWNLEPEISNGEAVPN